MKMLLLLGASATGKSTLCEALGKNYDWKIKATDSFRDAAYVAAIPVVQSIVESIFRNARLSLPEEMLPNMVHFGIMNELLLKIGEKELKINFEDRTDLPELEKELMNAGFNRDEVLSWTNVLHDIADRCKELPEVQPLRDLQVFFESFVQHATSSSVDTDTVILDVNPHPAFGPDKISIISEILVARHNNALSNVSKQIELLKTMAYCHPCVLSQRVLHRIKINYEGNMGTGLFPFEQLSQLVSPALNDAGDVLFTVTPKEISDIVHAHAEDASTSLETYMKAYRDLTGKFGVQGDFSVKLVVNKDYQCDLLPIDTNSAGADDLAAEIFRQVEEYDNERSFRFNG